MAAHIHYRAILNLRMQHNAYYFNVLYACVARSAGWRKNLRNSLCRLRTPEIFSQGAIGVLPVNRTMKNNKFLYRQPFCGWRYF